MSRQLSFYRRLVKKQNQLIVTCWLVESNLVVVTELVKIILRYAFVPPQHYFSVSLRKNEPQVKCDSVVSLERPSTYLKRSKRRVQYKNQTFRLHQSLHFGTHRFKLKLFNNLKILKLYNTDMS